MKYLDYRSLKTLKDLSSKIDLKEITPKKLYRDYQKENQICQLLNNSLS